MVAHGMGLWSEKMSVPKVSRPRVCHRVCNSIAALLRWMVAFGPTERFGRYRLASGWLRLGPQNV